jgi:hypothetical protein
MNHHVMPAFSAEVEKLAGFLRAGRRPISATKLLKKEGEMVKRSKKAVFEKVSAKAFLAGVAAGAGGLHLARKANEDRKMGKQLRIQQRGY